jgi:exopolysaccharide biosynthesis polyprenyl glycosylphosphotransferase
MAATASDAELRLPAGTSAVRTRVARRRLVRATLVSADVLGICLAYAAAAAAADGGFLTHAAAAGVFLVTLPAWVLGASLCGLYEQDDRDPGRSTLEDGGRILLFVSVASWLGVALVWALGLTFSTPSLLVFWAVATASIVVLRAAGRLIARRHPDYPQSTIVVGAGEVGQLVGRKLVQHPEFGLRLLGFVDAEPREMRGDLAGVPVLGSPVDLAELVKRHQVDRVIVAFSHDRHDRLVDLVRSLHRLDVRVDLVPRLFESVGPVVALHAVEGLPLLTLPPTQPSRLARNAKRAVDVIVAGTLLVLCAPLMAVIAFVIKRGSPGPILFRQLRLGEGQRPFTLLKFRTMAADTDDAPHRDYLKAIMTTTALPGENNLYKPTRTADVTKNGRWLRRTSMDELPQLINVLRGDMSLVGPRPCIPYELELYEPHHFDRFLVPAGLTGLWQVSARAKSSFSEALDLDAEYARGWSFALDLQLLLRTPAHLVRPGATR